MRRQNAEWLNMERDLTEGEERALQDLLQNYNEDKKRILREKAESLAFNLQGNKIS